jgi:uncharacterized protein YjiS (DUF1127 family)
MINCCAQADIYEPGPGSSQARGRARVFLQKWYMPVRRFWQERQRLRASRRAIRQLKKLDDAALRDIGIRRGDVARVSRLPNSADATAELELLARGHRRSRSTR